MALTVTDTQLAKAVAALDDGCTATFAIRRIVADEPPRRGSPVEIGRGRSLVRLPGEDGFRDLLPFEVEALLALAAAGEVRFTCPFAPAIGATRARTLPVFRLEAGRRLKSGEPEYPTRALGGAP